MRRATATREGAGVEFRRFRRLGVAARRLLERRSGQQREQDAGQAHDHERPAPADRLRQEAAGNRPDHPTQRDAERVGRQRRRPLVGRVVVADQRLRRRRASRLADADPDAAEQQQRKAGRRAAERGHARPDGQAHRDDGDAAPPLRQPRDRDAEDGVEEGEREAAEQAELGVVDLHVDLDRLAKRADDRPVDEVGGVDQHQQDHDPPGITM